MSERPEYRACVGIGAGIRTVPKSNAAEKPWW